LPLLCNEIKRATIVKNVMGVTQGAQVKMIGKANDIERLDK